MLRFVSKSSGNSRSTLARSIVWAALVVLAIAGTAFALQAKAPRPAGGKTAPAAGAPKSGAAAPAAATKATPKPRIDTVAQQAFLQTPEWKEMASEFDDWLAGQLFYDDQTVAQTRLRLAAGIDRMSAEQLKTFLSGMQAKLEILYSPLAQEAEEFFMQKLAVASPAYIQRIRDQFPDILTATAAQLAQRLQQYAARRQGAQAKQQAFDDSRQRRVASNQAQIEARQQARQRAAERRGNSAAITAASTPNDFTPARDYFPQQGNNGAFGIPGIGFGAGIGIVW